MRIKFRIARSEFEPKLVDWFSRLYFASLCGFLANIFNESGFGLEFLFSPTWAILYAFTLLFLITKMAGRGVPVRVWVVVFFSLYILLSPFWSVLKLQSFVYSFGLAGNALFAVMISLYISPRRILLNLRWALNFMLIFGIIGYLLGYEGAQYYDGLNRHNILGGDMMQGMFTHKNYLSVYAVSAFVINFYTTFGRYRYFVCSVAIASVLLAGSSTGLVALVIAISAMIFIYILRNKSLVFLAPLFVSLGAFLTLIVIIDTSMVLEALGRDASLTGRTELWHWAVVFFLEKPIVGWGYGGIFANSGPGPSDIFTGQYYDAPHFHNGFLQVLAETGIVGFLFVLIFVFGALYRTGRFVFKHNDETMKSLFIFYVTILCVMFAINILMRYNDLTFVVILLGYLGDIRNSRAISPDRKVLNGRRLELSGLPIRRLGIYTRSFSD